MSKIQFLEELYTELKKIVSVEEMYQKDLAEQGRVTTTSDYYRIYKNLLDAINSYETNKQNKTNKL